MEWLTVRLLVNHWRGKRGELVEVPAVIAAAMIAGGEAELAARETEASTAGPMPLGDLMIWRQYDD
ncbi:MAG: hypothetical protein ACM3US_07220 [Sphingomonadaceae bacterium]